MQVKTGMGEGKMKEIQTRLRQVEMDIETTNRRINTIFVRLSNTNKQIGLVNKKMAELEMVVVGLFDMVEMDSIPEYLMKPLVAIKRRRVAKSYAKEAKGK